MEDNYLLYLREKVSKAAKAVAKKWAGQDVEDLEQDIWLLLAESPNVVTDLLEQHDAVQLDWLVRIGHQEASKERSDYEVFSGQFLYSTDEVRGLLDSGGLDSQNTWRAEVSDLLEAFEGLAPAFQASVLGRYVDGWLPETSAEKMRLSRAVAAVTSRMNRIGLERRRNYQGPGARTNEYTR